MNKNYLQVSESNTIMDLITMIIFKSKKTFDGQKIACLSVCRIFTSFSVSIARMVQITLKSLEFLFYIGKGQKAITIVDSLTVRHLTVRHWYESLIRKALLQMKLL